MFRKNGRSRLSTGTCGAISAQKNEPAPLRLVAEVLAEAEYTPAIDDLSAAGEVEPDEALRTTLQEYLDILERIVAR